MQPAAPPQDQPYRTDADAIGVVAAFLAATLPKAGWTHRAHLTAGLWLLSEGGLEAARDRMPAAIKRFNAATGTADTTTSGYHETITQFYLTVIDEFRRGSAPSRGVAETANALFAALGDRGLPLRCYSSALLWSTEARLRWMLPDLRPVEGLASGT